MIRPLIFILLAFCTFEAFAQEVISPATRLYTPSGQQVKMDMSTLQAKGGSELELPFLDDFSVDHFPGNPEGYPVFWEGRQATRNTGYGINPPTLGVVSLDGADEIGFPYNWSQQTHGYADTLTSQPINLNYTPESGVGMSFYFQPKGHAPYGPNAPQDSLFLEFYSPNNDMWFWVWTAPFGMATDSFHFAHIPITSNLYLQAGFQFRFRNTAYLQGAYGTWNLDYIWIDINNNSATSTPNDVAFSRQEYSLLHGYSAMPRDHFAENPAAHMKAVIDVQFHNMYNQSRTLIENQMHISHNGVLLASYANSASPAIPSASYQEYNHSVSASPNEFVFDPDLDDTELNIDVKFIHAVDFQATATNDTMRFTQRFFTHYAYDDGSAEAGYSVPSVGANVAMRFTNYKPDSVFAIQLYTMPIYNNLENTSFTIKLWEDTGNGPGAELGDALASLSYGLEGYQDSPIYQFEAPIYVPSGSFFAGYANSNQVDGVKVGIDFNTNGNDGNLYRMEGGSWQPSSIQGSVMIRPMFTSNGYEDLVTSVDRTAFDLGLNLYPNPTRDFVTITADVQGQINISVFDLGGKLVIQDRMVSNARLDVSSLKNGFYLVQLRTNEGSVATRKLIVNR